MDVLTEFRVVARPGKAPPEAAATEPPARELAAAEEGRASFRQVHFGLRWPPTKEDLLIELAEPDVAPRIAAVPKITVLEPRDSCPISSPRSRISSCAAAQSPP